MKKIISSFLLVFLTLLISSHECWLQPDKFIYTPGDEIKVNVLVGENFEGQNWTGNNKSIQSMRLYLSDVTDEIGGYIGNTPGDSVAFTMNDEGTYMITCNTNSKHIELNAAEFNSYLEEDELTDAIAYRKEHNEMDSTGRENYQRSIKTIFQVGDDTTRAYKRQTNLPLDIIPLANPYAIHDGDTLKVKVLFNKLPLSNALMKIWYRDSSGTTKTGYHTNEKGELSFPVNRSGRWMVTSVKMIRLTGIGDTKWQSYWGSLTWGYIN